MRIKKEWKYHISLAIFLLAMNLFEDYMIGGNQEFMRVFKLPYFGFLLTFYMVLIGIYFINFKVVCPKYLKKHKIHQFILATLILIGMFAGIRFLLEEVILFKITGVHNYYDSSRRLNLYLFDNAYFAIKTILYSTLIYLTINFMKVKDHNKAELDLLRSQIGPHFLFNTLNAFYVELIDDKPDTAKDIHKLSELLRYVTYDSQKDYVSLHDEIKFLNDYIHFFNKRFENELSVDFKVIGDIKNQQIPSLILIHFIENLFKHGVVNDKKNPALISINIADTFIEVKTKNKIQTSEKFMESGIGTDNIKRRLSTIYGSLYKLEYKTELPYFSTYLKMPL